MFLFCCLTVSILFRISEPSDLPQSSFLPTNGSNAGKEKLPTNTLLENELTAATSRLKDDIDGLLSNARLKQITTEASIVDTGKNYQRETDPD